jgi:hypothetical protein
LFENEIEEKKKRKVKVEKKEVVQAARHQTAAPAGL